MIIELFDRQGFPDLILPQTVNHFVETREKKSELNMVDTAQICSFDEAYPIRRHSH